MGIIVPLVSNIVPAKQAMMNSLRDQLDIHRAKVDELTV